MPETDFKSERVSKCASIELNAHVKKVFPLFGPILEKEWAEGWDPEIIYSETGIVEEHMIFRTKAHRHSSEDHYLWAITKYIPDQHQIEYTVSTPNRIWFINVQCKAAGDKTIAEICYTYTGLNNEGNLLNREALNSMYAQNLADWAEAINYYLKTGELFSNN